MNISEQTLSVRTQRRVTVFATQVVLATLLTACAESQTPDDGNVTPDTGTTAGRPSGDFQTNDGSNSVSYAQAVAAGEISDSSAPVIVVPPSNAVPDTGAANPDPVDETPENPFEPVPEPEPEAEPEAEAETDNSSDGLDTPEPEAEDNTDSNPEAQEPDAGGTPDSSTPDEPSTDNGVTDESSTDNESPDAESPASPTPDEQEPDEEVPPVDSPATEDTASKTPGEPADSGAEAEPDNPDSGADANPAQKSSSHTTPGFEGEVIDGAIRVTWAADPLARGYNVYRQAKYITTVMTNEYIDTDVYDRDYYYEIQAFDYDDKLYYIATGLTVSPRTLGKTDPNAPVANPDLLDGYQLVFADEFQGMTLDSSKWNTSYLWGSDVVINYEEQHYVDILRDPDFGYNPFTFDGEYMTINSIKTPPELAEKALGQPYLSGVITSYDAFKFTYGYAETRAKLTYGRGYWPAFWLLNAYYGGDDPEIDIMEFIGGDQDVVYHTFHYYDSEGQLRSTKSQPTPGIDYTNDFHTFAVDWRPGTIIYYVDGIEVHRVTDTKVPSEQMYVIANTAMGGWWAQSPDESTPFPGEYIIDYIRVYQKDTPYDDVLLDDGMTNVPFADEIPGQSSPSHKPGPDMWPDGYPYRQP